MNKKKDFSRRSSLVGTRGTFSTVLYGIRSENDGIQVWKKE
jgi:hypothetical protein